MPREMTPSTSTALQVAEDFLKRDANPVPVIVPGFSSATEDVSGNAHDSGNGSKLANPIEAATSAIAMPRPPLDGRGRAKLEIPSACGALRTASRAVTQFYDLVLAPTGLKATQFILLQAIHQAGEVAQCDFAREHTIAVATLSRRFSGLRKKGYIQIRMGERHGERIYRLTEKGMEAFHNALPYWDRAQHRLQTALGDEDWRIMMELAERIRGAARDAEQLRTDNQIHPSAILVSAD